MSNLAGGLAHVQAISYDIWKTLLGGNRAFTPVRLAHIARRLDLTVGEAELMSAYRQTDKDLNDRNEVTGQDGGMAERLEYMFGLLGVTRPIPSQAYLEKIQAELGVLRCLPEHRPPLLEPDLLSTLQALTDLGYRQVLLSNSGMDGGPIMRPLLTSIGILQHMEFAMLSAEEVWAKPNPLLFLRLAEALGLEPHQILHIGDNRRADYGGATAAGFQALHYTVDPTDVPAIARLSQLPELLRQARSLSATAR